MWRDKKDFGVSKGGGKNLNQKKPMLQWLNFPPHMRNHTGKRNAGRKPTTVIVMSKMYALSDDELEY
jgi:hypothetical protein